MHQHNWHLEGQESTIVMELERKYDEYMALDQMKTNEAEATVIYGWAHHQAAVKKHNEALQYLQSYRKKIAR